MHPITRRELWQAQATLLTAILLQLSISSDLRFGSKYAITALELGLLVAIAFLAPRRHRSAGRLNKTVASLMIGLVSIANAGTLILVANALINGSHLPGHEILSAALAIFLTNIVVFGLWFWEIDSPGLSGSHKQNASTHFQFPQTQNDKHGNWRPTFFDYLYVSLTNSTAFSPTDALPLTHTTKFLMGFQALISLVTVVLVTARAVNILG